MTPPSKALAKRLAETIGLLVRVRDALRENRPLWTVGVYEEEEVVLETLKLFKD